MILGIVGKAGHGKDTVADFLVREYGFKKESYANSLKWLTANCFSLHIDLFTKNELKDYPFETPLYLETEKFDIFINKCQEITGVECPFNVSDFDGRKFNTPRELLQFLGTDIGRKYFGETIWIDAFYKIIDTNSNIVIPDCRFSNEVTSIHKRQGKVLMVNRPSVADVNSHESESNVNILWKQCDHIIYNTGSLDDLYTNTTKFINIQLKK